jgi:hypothetical protein
MGLRKGTKKKVQVSIKYLPRWAARRNIREIISNLSEFALRQIPLPNWEDV